MKWGKNQATLGHFANWIPAEKIQLPFSIKRPY